MLGGNGYTCGVCPSCGANDFWNEHRCMTCDYVQEPEENEEAE